MEQHARTTPAAGWVPQSSHNASSSSDSAALSASSSSAAAPSDSYSAPQAPGTEDKEYKLFIGGMPFETTARDLRKIFGRFEAVHDASVARWSGKRSKGYGFISFRLSEDEERARLALHKSEFHGRTIHIKIAQNSDY